LNLHALSKYLRLFGAIVTAAALALAGYIFFDFKSTATVPDKTVPDKRAPSQIAMNRQQPVASPPSNAAPDQKKASKSGAIPLKQGMQYVDARKLLIGGGWKAPAPPPGGNDENSSKVVEECSGDLAMCNSFPEIKNCSGQGYCLMEFTDEAGNILDVTTYGDLSGNSPDASVTAWQRKNTP
jgi:hypothetical protein